ncbi:GIY-YIG nuclease family protein [Candidatus Curtissbacteria bacterium]|nr:GIY-YIG nuclease family protein [Candidatus Curtissbacteria bacterium]
MDIRSKIRALPQNPGVYQFYDKDGQLLYVGKSINIKKRVASYFASKDLGPKTTRLVENIADVKFIKVFSEFEALMLESDLIRENKPFYNIIAKDDKSPIYIKITKDEIPQITLSRKAEFTKGAWIKGPFPSVKMTKQILKHVRRIFPYCQHKNPKKPCLYVHLGLCPYPYRDEASRESYKHTISRIKLLLSGKLHILQKDLTSQMKVYSQEQEYEKAADIKRKLQYLEYLTMEFRDPKEFLGSPGLVDDYIQKRVDELQKVLDIHEKLNRIECYDISNIQGTNATGSMVVFTNGVADKSQYRRFKVRVIDTPNDFLMMREVLTRRLGAHRFAITYHRKLRSMNFVEKLKK